MIRSLAVLVLLAASTASMAIQAEQPAHDSPALQNLAQRAEYGSAIGGESDLSFASQAALQGTVVVILPNGGEEYQIGDTCVITWWASDPGGYIDTAWIVLSRDAGATYNDSIKNVRNMLGDEPWLGTYVWEVEGPASDSCKMKVIVWDSAGNSAEDVSDDFFKICPVVPSPGYYFRTDTSGVYTGSGDTVRLFMDEPGDSSAYAACTTAGTPGDQSVLYYSCPNPTQYDTAAWVTDSFGVDTTISSGTWRFILWARVDTFHYDPPFDWLLHYIGVKVYRYRGGIPETLLFEAFKGGPGAWLNTDWGADTIDVDTSSVSFLAGDRLWAEVWTERDASVDDPVQVEFAYNNRPGQHDSRFRPGVIVGVSERENQEKSHPPFFVEPLRGGFRAHTYSFTQCSVFDVAGRLVRRSAVRSGIAQFRNLPSGIYFLVLEAGKDRAYHKVLVLR